MPIHGAILTLRTESKQNQTRQEIPVVPMSVHFRFVHTFRFVFMHLRLFFFMLMLSYLHRHLHLPADQSGGPTCWNDSHGKQPNRSQWKKKYKAQQSVLWFFFLFFFLLLFAPICSCWITEFTRIIHVGQNLLRHRRSKYVNVCVRILCINYYVSSSLKF